MSAKFFWMIITLQFAQPNFSSAVCNPVMKLKSQKFNKQIYNGKNKTKQNTAKKTRFWILWYRALRISSGFFLVQFFFRMQINSYFIQSLHVSQRNLLLVLIKVLFLCFSVVIIAD